MDTFYNLLEIDRTQREYSAEKSGLMFAASFSMRIALIFLILISMAYGHEENSASLDRQWDAASDKLERHREMCRKRYQWSNHKESNIFKSVVCQHVDPTTGLLSLAGSGPGIHNSPKGDILVRRHNLCFANKLSVETIDQIPFPVCRRAVRETSADWMSASFAQTPFDKKGTVPGEIVVGLPAKTNKAYLQKFVRRNRLAIKASYFTEKAVEKYVVVLKVPKGKERAFCSRIANNSVSCAPNWDPNVEW